MQRRSIDEIIELAFSARLDRHYDFRTEERYRLLASAGNPDAESDTLVTIPSWVISSKIRKQRASTQIGNESSILQHLYWSTKGIDANYFSIIGFAGEFKKDESDYNENQLVMVLTTAQAQRKALELKPSIIMGAVACRGQLKLFSSCWTNDNSFVQIYEHKQQFNLSDPIHVLHFYVFCSKLERHLQGLAMELKTLKIPNEMALQSRIWRSPDHSRKRRRTESVDSGHGSNGGGGGEGGNNGPVEAGESDWYANVAKWCDDVAKDRKDLVVPGDAA